MKVALVFLAIICGIPIKSKSITDPFKFVLSGDSFQWPSRSVRNIFTSSGRYIPKHIIPTKFQTRGLHAVIAFPRLRRGVPVTLGKIPLLANFRVPEIKPFPNWSLQDEDCDDGIKNAVDVYADERGVLWVLDTGVVNTLESPIAKGRPQVFGFDFLTGKQLYKVNLSPYSSTRSDYQYIVAENTLGRPFIYVSCSATNSILVWDVKNNRGGVVPLPNPVGSSDILYMVFLRPKPTEPVLVFSHISFPSLFGVKVSSLRDGQLGTVANLGEKTGEMVILGTDNASKIFFRWKNENKIRAWDLGNYKEMGVIVDEGDPCRTSTQVTGGSRLFTWTLESNFYDFVNGQVGCVGASAYIRPLVKEKHR